MSEKNFDFSDFSESVSNKPSNLKNDIFTTKIYNAKNGSNKSLLIVEKLSKKKNQLWRNKAGFNKEELKLVNPNKSHIIDYDKTLAFNLANNIVRRRFRYFWGKNEDDSEEDIEREKPIVRIERTLKYNEDMKRLEEEKRKERERLEKEKKEKERLEREKKEKERLERLEKERKEKERLEREKKEKLERELKEKAKREKQKQKEMMKTIEVNIEERNRQNHNYKIISKITKEIEISDNNRSNYKKYNEEPQKENKSLKLFKNNSEMDVSKSSKTFVAKNRRPEINTQRISREDNNNLIKNINQVKIEVNKKTIIKETKDSPTLLNKANIHQITQAIKHDSRPEDSKIENKKVIIVNKIGDAKKNNEINKIVLQKNVIQKDITVQKYGNYNTEGNVRNKYKNKKINNKILDEL